MSTTPDPDEGRRIHALDRAHVFHSWSAQGALDPLVIAGAEGSYFWDDDGNRYLDFSLAAGQREHRPPAPEGGRGDPGAGGDAVHDRAAARERRARRGGPADRRARARRPHKVFFTNGGAEANENAVRMARLHTGPPQGAVDLPQLPRRHRRGDPGDRRPAALAERVARPASCTSGARTSTGRASTRRRPSEECERALQHLDAGDRLRGPEHDRRDPAGDRRRHERHPGPAARLPRRRARAVRQARHRVHRRRGHGRIRPLRRVVRGRALRRHARPHHVRQGRRTPATSRSAA